MNLDQICSFLYEIKDFKYELFFREKLKEISPTSRNLTLYGNALLANDLNNLAMNAYVEANKNATGKEAWIKSNIGNLYNNVGLFEFAETNFKESLEMEKENQYAHERLARVLKNKEDEKRDLKKLSIIYQYTRKFTRIFLRKFT